MIGYAEKFVFTKIERHALNVATALVSVLPSELEERMIRCHELARAIAIVLGLRTQDGGFGIVEHTWCLIDRSPEDQLQHGREHVILDVYVPGPPQVQLIDTFALLPHAKAYRAEAERADINMTIVDTLVHLLYDDCLAAGKLDIWNRVRSATITETP